LAWEGEKVMDAASKLWAEIREKHSEASDEENLKLFIAEAKKDRAVLYATLYYWIKHEIGGH
jgi:hypothetical protein